MRTVTPESWAATLLARLGIRQSPGAIRAVVGWEHAEGGNWNNTAAFNPLNTTQPEPGAGNTGTQGNIKVYRDWNQGLNATVATLRNGRYGGILSALKSGNAGSVADAIGSSPWGTSSSLIHSVIGGTHVGGGAQPVAGLAGGGGGPVRMGGASPAGSASPSGQSTPGDPGQAGDFMGMVSSLLSQQARPSAPSASPLPAPSFAAAPALPQTYTQIQPVGAPAPPAQDRVQAGLSLVGALGGTAATIGSSGSLAGPQTGSGAPMASASAPSGGGPAVGKAPKIASFDGKQVAGWIVPALEYARQHGWKGTVSSGYRSYAQQKAIYDSGVRPAARPGTSNHEGTQFPRGAVDVTDAQQLAQILQGSPYRDRLQYAGSKDPVHFSHPHNGGY